MLNAPTLVTLDNPLGEVSVGQLYPVHYGRTSSPSLGTVTPTITYNNNVGVTQVTPRIDPDGKILMRVQPSIINPIATQINIGSGLRRHRLHQPGHLDDNPRR